VSRDRRSGRGIPPPCGCRHVVVVAGLVFVGALLARPSHAQEGDTPAPLSKSQLIRLVTTSAYTQAELVQIVERSCLSFEPTERDLEDLSSLGAGAPVLGAVQACTDSDGQAASAVAAGAATLTVADRSISGRVGTTVEVAATLRSEGGPVTGRRLLLRGSGDITGGSGSDASATTDDAGRAVFSVQTGTASLVYPLTVTATQGRLSGNPNVELLVRPGPPARADFSPARLRLGSGAHASRVEITVRDQFGNPIPNALVALELPAAAGGATLPGTTDSRGVAGFAVVTTGLRPGDRLGLSAGGVPIGELEVAVPDVLAAEGQPGQPAVSEAAEGGPPAEGAAAADSVAAAGGGAMAGGGARPISNVPLDTLIAEGRRAAAGGEFDRASTLYRQALKVDPTSVEAQTGLAKLSMDRGEPENAMLWYQEAVGNAPNDVALWLGLGRARSAAGYEELADQAFRRVLELDPDNAEARQMLAGLTPGTPLLKGSVWGGNTFDNNRSFGLRAAELIVYPLPSLSIWGRYDNTLALYQWALVRGRDDVEGFYGGLGLEWGARHALSTRFEVGRREPPGDTGLYQNFYQFEQGLRIGSGLGALRVAAGGYLGRWFDRDDWQIYAKAEIPAGALLTFVPAIYVGETVGSAFGEVGRVPADELRGYLTLDFRPLRAVRLQPSFGLGSVSSEDARLDGTLLDALFQATVGSGVVRGEAFLRYQDPPGVESFTVVAIGLTLGVPRGGF
jgi:tetratricopeptide (TPR) repeat protein